MNPVRYASDLRAANILRQAEWDAGNQLTLTYRLNELAGETGEACNVGKKIERERLGIRGSRATVEQLAEELADVVICADLVAMGEGIDLEAAVIAKFNATSEKVGLSTRLARSAAPHCQHCGGEIQGWCCQSCPAEFKENDAGELVFETSPFMAVATRRAIAIIAGAANQIGWQAGEAGSDIAGGIVSFLVAHPQHIDRFISAPNEVMSDGTFDPHKGALTWRTQSGEIINREIYHDRKTARDAKEKRP